MGKGVKGVRMRMRMKDFVLCASDEYTQLPPFPRYARKKKTPARLNGRMASDGSEGVKLRCRRRRIVDHSIMHLAFFLGVVGFGLSTALERHRQEGVSDSRSVVILGYSAGPQPVAGRGGRDPYLMASSKTLLRLRWVSAEHSKYLTALISLATASACS